MKVLFINNKKAKDSIYESGLMVYNNLKSSSKYVLDYIEIDVFDRKIPSGYHFYFFNYHPITMSWLDTNYIKNIPGIKMTIVLEVSPNDPFVMCPKNIFDIYIVLDPTIKLNEKSGVYPFPRPLEKIDININSTNKSEIPVIGTFGFATKGKGFQHVVEAVNKEFDNAIIKINIPHGTFIPESEKYADFLSNICKQKAKTGIEVIVTHDYMTKEELIKWCSENTLNCFLYDRNMPGLAATTDQCIVSGKPLSVSENDTFRHITQYINPYPKWSLKDSIEKSLPFIKKMKQDWSPEIFIEKFERLLEENFNKISINENDNHEILLKKNNRSFSSLVKNKLKSILSLLKNLFKRKVENKNDKLI